MLLVIRSWKRIPSHKFGFIIKQQGIAIHQCEIADT